MTDLETCARPVTETTRETRSNVVGQREALDFDFSPDSDDAYGALLKLRDEASGSLRDLCDGFKKSKTADALAKTWEAVKEGLSRERTDWTIAVNLTTDYGSGCGVEQRMTELGKLADKTKGKPVTLVVQAARPDYSTEEAFFSGVPDGHCLDRYVIRDGKMTWIETAKSEGFAKDTENLLAFTGKRFEPKQLGLIVDSHGNGNRGLTGDTGSVTVPEFAKAVKAGLQAARRTSLDVLDFDCCLMAQNGVVNEIKELARNVVASAETEHISGQELVSPLEKIFANSTMTGDQVAGEFVTASRDKQAAADAVATVLRYFGVDQSARSPIKTLSHISVKEYNAFAGSLDKFGDKMCDALKDDQNQLAIEKAVDATTTYGGSPPLLLFWLFGANKSKYDLKEFTSRIVKSIDAGEIKDADGSLKASAQDVLAQRGKLVAEYFGHGKYADLGGLSVFLPGRDLRTSSLETVQRTYKAELVVADSGWGKFRYALRRDK